MKLKEYIAELKIILKNFPELKDAELIYACDDEGNSFNKVFYTPSIGAWADNEFTDVRELTYAKADKRVNAICIN
jgi:hypothetical protein